MSGETSEKPQPACYLCGHRFAEGETGWVEDWTVIGDDYRSARRETRYTCDPCEELRTRPEATS